MTLDEAKELLINIIKQVSNTNPKLYAFDKTVKRINIDLFNFIESYCSDKLNGHKFTEKIYWITHKLHDFPECKICHKPLKKAFKQYNVGYSFWCSRNCLTKDPDIKKKMRETCMKHFGSEHYFSTKQFKDNLRKTTLEKYGVEYPTQRKEVKDKIKQSVKEKYGVDYVSQLESVKNKKIETCKRNYGTNHPLQCKEILERKDKTTTERYGSKCAYSDPAIMQKQKDTCMRKYGTEYTCKSEEVKQKVRNTVLQRYGYPNAMQNPNVVSKMMKTSIERYGYPCCLMNPEISKKSKKKLYFKEIYFDSAWEILYYFYLKRNNINFEYHTKSIIYQDTKHNNHTYYIDFFLSDSNQLVEIKGDQFFDKNGKMIDIYSENDDGSEELKHQCMLSNNVKIFKQKDLEDIGISVKYSGWIRKFCLHLEETKNKFYNKDFSIINSKNFNEFIEDADKILKENLL